MTQEKRVEIAGLAATAHQKAMALEKLSMLNSNVDTEARKLQFIEYCLAKRESIEADRALFDAMNA